MKIETHSTFGIRFLLISNTNQLIIIDYIDFHQLLIFIDWYRRVHEW